MSLTSLKKGDTVILHMFTGIAVGVKEVLAADKSTVTLETRSGMAKFSRKTGKQVEPKAKSERFANYITEDDGSFKPGNKTTSKKKAKKAEDKKATKKAKPVPQDDEDEDEEEPEEKPAKKVKKPAKAEKPAKSKKKAKKPDPEEDFDDDDYEEEE